MGISINQLMISILDTINKIVFIACIVLPPFIVLLQPDPYGAAWIRAAFMLGCTLLGLFGGAIFCGFIALLIEIEKNGRQNR